jgi:hypothetical protein
MGAYYDKYEVFIDNELGALEKESITILTEEHINVADTILIGEEYFVITEVENDCIVVRNISKSSKQVLKVI